MMTNYLIIISALPQAESARTNTSKSRDPKTPQGRAKSSGNTANHTLTENQSPAELALHAFSALPPKALRHDIHLTRTYRKAEDKIRRLRDGNILNKIPVLQNEPNGPRLKCLGFNVRRHRDFHRTQGTHGSPGSLPRILEEA
jgi:hypothetical protein